MKKLILLFMAISLIACSVEPLDYEEENMYFNASSELNNCLGPDNSKTISITQATAIASWGEVRNLYWGLLPQEVSKSGTFSPSIKELIGDFKKIGLGEYTTIYSINSPKCTDSVTLTIFVETDPIEEPVCEIDAGPDNSIILTYSQASAIESWDEVRKLYLSLLQAGVSRNGTFDPSIWNLINEFQSSPIGNFSTTYTIGSGDCKDSVILTVIVIPDPQEEPLCELDAGVDKIISLSVEQAVSLESWDEVRKLYLSMLQTGVPRNGDFSPSIKDLIRMFNDPNRSSLEGEYTTNYSISDGDCVDSVELTVKVISN
jgi:hypothetical protein